MRWLRHSRPIAVFTLTVWVAFVAAQSLFLHEGDDACDIVLIAHDAAKHRFEDGTAPGGYDPVAEHCQACHFPRTLPARTATVTPHPTPASPVVHELVATDSFLVATRIPGRSPPA